MTAIQAAQHEHFCKAIDSLALNNKNASLSSEKAMIENLYAEYCNKISDVKLLIASYKKIQLETRKKMSGYQRQMQRPSADVVLI